MRKELFYRHIYRDDEHSVKAEYGNKIDIDKVTSDITAFKNKVERYASKKLMRV